MSFRCARVRVKLFSTWVRVTQWGTDCWVPNWDTIWQRYWFGWRKIYPTLACYVCGWERKHRKWTKVQARECQRWDDTIHNTRLVINLKVMQMLLHGLNYLHNLAWFKVIVLFEELYSSKMAKIHSLCALLLPKYQDWCLGYYECRSFTILVTNPASIKLLSCIY